MKVVLIIVGSLGGVYAIVGIVQLFQVFGEAEAGSAQGGSMMAASVVPVCIGLALCAACFQRAFRKPGADDPSDGQEQR